MNSVTWSDLNDYVDILQFIDVINATLGCIGDTNISNHITYNGMRVVDFDAYVYIMLECTAANTDYSSVATDLISFICDNMPISSDKFVI